jgi:Protein of unknown function (DUF2808)
MKFQTFALSTALTVATIVSAHSPALSQDFQTATHPRLSEIGTSQTQSQAAQPPTILSQRAPQTNQSKLNIFQNFQTPTHARLFEIGAFQTLPQVAQLPAILSQGMPQTAQVKLNNGQTYFSTSPRLTRSAASEKGAYAPSTYEFTLAVPADAGQPLKAVTIAQAENAETIRFDVPNSKAFAGNRYAAGPVIPLASIGGSQPANSKAVTIVFDQPVQPGSTVTVALEAKANPTFGGIYEFGVTAFPGGENGTGLFLGFGRLSFYSTSD